MIVNGQYIKYDEKKAADIQKQLNKQDDVYSNVKSDIQDPQKTVGDEGHSLGFGFSVFDEDETKTTRFERYGYYREMAQMEFINRGLEIVADDSTLDNTEGNVVKFYSNNESIKDSLWELFHNRLDINSELWGIVYETAKMGDNFYEIIPDSYDNPTKIVYLRYLKPEKIDRIEQNGKLLYYTYKTEEDRSEDKSYDPTRVGLGNDESPEKIYKLQPWQIVHFKVKDDKDELPYGASLLKAGIRTYRRLALLEDVILVYRISRAPERRVFYIDVGQMNYTDSKKFIQKIKSQYRTENFLDENGNINRKSNILSTTSDIFVPRREGGQGTQIDTLQGGEALKSIEDLDYFKDKILRLLNIPLAYLGGEADRSRGSLSQLDYKFSRFIERIQSQIKRGLNKVAAIELYFNGYKRDDLTNFDIELTPPSNIKEITDIDIMNQRMNLIATVQQTELFSQEWILKNILKLSEKEISDIKLQKQMEQQQGQQGGGEGAAGGGGEFGPAEVGAAAGGGEEAAAGGEEAGGGEAEGGEEAAAGGEEGAETADTDLSKEQQLTEALVKVLGKEFLIENSEDFFKLIKYLKEDAPNDKIPLFERISEIVRQPVRSEKRGKTPSVRKQMILGEMKGLHYKRDGGRYMKLYEQKRDKEGKTYFEEYENELID
jgi:hypothetical protein